MATFKKRGKKGNELWSVIFDLPGHKERRQKRLSGFKSRQDANLAHISFLANYESPEEIEQEEDIILFEDARQDYFEILPHTVKESTQGYVISNFNKHISSFFEGMKIKDITSQDVTKWIMSLNNKNLKYQTKKKIIGVLRRFFNYCISNDFLDNNPIKKAIKIKNNEIKKEMLIWSEEEFKKFISVITDNVVYKTFFSFLYLTGCRRGEALALNWNDISNNILTINKTLGYHALKGGFNTTVPKNTFSNREIVLPDVLLKLLKELKIYYKKFVMFSDSNYIFGNLRPLPPETIRRKLKEYCDKAGVKIIRIHDFRHSHASLLISKGHDIVTVARRLGHSDIEMTLNRYSHVMPNKQTEIANTLNYDL